MTKSPRIIPATLDHIDDMYEIEMECFSDPWSRLSLGYEVTHKYSISLVAMFDGVAIGHGTMRHIINEGHINNIAVRKSSQRQGIGSLLLKGLIEAAQIREMIGITLEVRESNKAAIALYEKYGFETQGIRKNYYSLPTENGLIMWKMLEVYI